MRITIKNDDEKGMKIFVKREKFWYLCIIHRLLLIDPL